MKKVLTADKKAQKLRKRLQASDLPSSLFPSHTYNMDVKQHHHRNHANPPLSTQNLPSVISASNPPDSHQNAHPHHAPLSLTYLRNYRHNEKHPDFQNQETIIDTAKHKFDVKSEFNSTVKGGDTLSKSSKSSSNGGKNNSKNSKKKSKKSNQNVEESASEGKRGSRRGRGGKNTLKDLNEKARENKSKKKENAPLSEEQIARYIHIYIYIYIFFCLTLLC